MKLSQRFSQLLFYYPLFVCFLFSWRKDAVVDVVRSVCVCVQMESNHWPPTGILYDDDVSSDDDTTLRKVGSGSVQKTHHCSLPVNLYTHCVLCNTRRTSATSSSSSSSSYWKTTSRSIVLSTLVRENEGRKREERERLRMEERLHSNSNRVEFFFADAHLFQLLLISFSLPTYVCDVMRTVCALILLILSLTLTQKRGVRFRSIHTYIYVVLLNNMWTNQWIKRLGGPDDEWWQHMIQEAVVL